MGLKDFFLQAYSGDERPARIYQGVLQNGLAQRDATSMALQRLSNQLTRNAAREGFLVGRNAPVGLDAVVQDWVRQEFIYRRSILQEMFLMAIYTSEIRSLLVTIKRDVFKRGLGDWVAKFKRICTNPDCLKEFQTEEEECDRCFLMGEEEEWVFDENNVPYKERRLVPMLDEEGKAIPTPTRPPDEDQKKTFDLFMKDVNSFHKSLLDTMKESMEDLLIADDMFILLNPEYKVNRATGKVYAKRIFEIVRLHPSLVEFDIDRKDGLPEQSHWLCPLHRNEQVGTSPGRCMVELEDGYCGAIMLPAMYRYYVRGHYRYYTRDEIIHKSYFSPSRTYGISPVYTAFEKTLTLRGIDRWYYRYFYERRIPPGLIITYTDDPDSLRGEIERVQLEMLDDPNIMPWIAASARTQRGRTDNVKLGYTFEEMDSISIRNEIRERLGNLWGVTPMHQGDPRQMGGLSRESSQSDMWDGTVESYQRALDDGVLDVMIEALGITDWKRILAPPNEKTEQEIVELNKLNIDIATGMQQLGYKPVLVKDTEPDVIKFEYEEMEGMPGMFGGGMPGMGFGDMGGGAPNMGDGQLPPPPPAPLDDEGPVEESPPSEGGSSVPFPPP